MTRTPSVRNWETRNESRGVPSSRMHLDFLLNDAEKTTTQAYGPTNGFGTKKQRFVGCEVIAGVQQNCNGHRYVGSSGEEGEYSTEQTMKVINDPGHRSVKSKKFSCERCGAGFGMKSNLKRHVMTVHEDRRGYQCKICGAAFGLKQNLVTHIRVKHERRRPFQCNICGISFGYKQVLQNHRRNIHGMADTK